MNQEPVEGMEWLAFEPEHALNFARRMAPPRKDLPRPPYKDDGIGLFLPRHGACPNKADETMVYSRCPPPFRGRETRPAPYKKGRHSDRFDESTTHHHRWPSSEEDPVQSSPRPHDEYSANQRAWSGERGRRQRPEPAPIDDQRRAYRLPSPEGETVWPARQQLYGREYPPPPFHGPQSPLMRLDEEESGLRKPPLHSKPGWLHTYKTKDILHLLYIDGTSAGKCDKGTLDSQDILLLNSTQDRHGGMFGEIERGKSLCKLANEAWGGKVKGFIRMEAGFEIILCSFKNNLDFVSAARAGLIGPVGTDPDSDDHEFLSSMKWIKAVAARYDSIGGGRVKLDYENFVTCYAYDLDLFKDENSLPRLTNLSTASLDKIRHDVDSMVLHWKLPTRDSGAIDWQSVADMVIERYGKALQFLVSGALNTPDAFFQELSVLLQVFVDSDNRNMTAEMERCVRQFVPTTADVSASVAARAITSVTHDICSSLITAFDVKVAVAESVEKLRQLMHYLGWSIWKKCGDCPLDEICFIPMWPFGAVEDFEHPQCRSAKNVNGRMGYWGQPAFGPPRKGYGYELPQTEVV
ncbi:hypothetical protein FOPE_03621 [Fonsecaea pedrosoi]|nr:hypothetical protein FOPE_03621 [Fonsecaea pedrosoi]